MFKTKTNVHGAFIHNRETGNKHLSATERMNVLSCTHMRVPRKTTEKEATINIHSDVNESLNNYAT